MNKLQKHPSKAESITNSIKSTDSKHHEIPQSNILQHNQVSELSSITNKSPDENKHTPSGSGSKKVLTSNKNVQRNLNPKFRSELGQWAVNHQVGFNAVKDLLDIMRKNVSIYETKKCNCLKKNSSTCFHNLIPFATMEKCLDFEKELSENPKKFDELKEIFLRNGNTDPIKFLKKSLTEVFEDELAREISWVSRKNKKCAQSLMVVIAIKNAFHRNFPKETDQIFEEYTANYFQNASDRISEREWKVQSKNGINFT